MLIKVKLEIFVEIFPDENEEPDFLEHIQQEAAPQLAGFTVRGAYPHLKIIKAEKVQISV